MIERLHIAFACGRDRDFLSSFLIGWRESFAGHGVKLIIANDVEDPIEQSEFDELPSTWPKRRKCIAKAVVTVYHEALKRWPAKYLVKHDIDTAILSGDWLLTAKESSGADMIGCASSKGHIYGGCYAIKAEAAMSLDPNGGFATCQEDAAITAKLRQRGANVLALPTDPVDISPVRGAIGLQWNKRNIGPSVGWVHTGEGGKTPEKRKRCADWQMEIIDFRHEIRSY